MLEITYPPPGLLLVQCQEPGKLACSENDFVSLSQYSRGKCFNCKEVPLKKLSLSVKTCSAYFYLNFFVIIFRLCFSSATHLNTTMYLFYLAHFHIQRIVEAEIQTVFVTGT